ncbi:hypothetical protein [Streptomyces poonensis]|uniref:Secreted protein n=1 Tax=Streptomyces poonensis TaxID=68255 RepID=A0A918PCC8_9ACTN|nr:hypothetical protein [Streptomyces poonensis]GGY98441.1 hypothetical protein GCM10010365_16260 [Streptomyces poonensis]
MRMRVFLSTTALAAGVLLATAAPATAGPHHDDDDHTISHSVDSHGYTYTYGPADKTDAPGADTTVGRGGLLGLGLFGIL